MRYLTIAIWLLMSAIPCTAQNEQRQSKVENKPDLSGIWALDQRRSYPASNRRQGSSLLTIVQRDPEIKMTTRFTLDGQDGVSDVVLYSDGRKERRYGHKGQVYDTKTTWEARTLVTTRKSTHTSIGYQTHYQETVEKWQLSKDGKTLTRRTISTVWPNNFEAILSTNVYTRAR